MWLRRGKVITDDIGIYVGVSIVHTNFYGRRLDSKDCKQLPKYLRVVDRNLTKKNIYNRIVKLMKSKRGHHREAEAIDADITVATQYGKY